MLLSVSPTCTVYDAAWKDAWRVCAGAAALAGCSSLTVICEPPEPVRLSTVSRIFMREFSRLSIVAFAAATQFVGYECVVNDNSGWTPVDNAAHCGAVRFAEGGQPELVAKSVHP